jgi:hypothetical protein
MQTDCENAANPCCEEDKNFKGQKALVGSGRSHVPDPWENRTERMKCKTCMWFNPKKADVAAINTSCHLPQLGRCRRHAPSMNGYPVVFVNDWCGDHKLDENKI